MPRRKPEPRDNHQPAPQDVVRIPAPRFTPGVPAGNNDSDSDDRIRQALELLKRPAWRKYLDQPELLLEHVANFAASHIAYAALSLYQQHTQPNRPPTTPEEQDAEFAIVRRAAEGIQPTFLKILTEGDGEAETTVLTVVPRRLAWAMQEAERRLGRPLTDPLSDEDHGLLSEITTSEEYARTALWAELNYGRRLALRHASQFLRPGMPLSQLGTLLGLTPPTTTAATTAVPRPAGRPRGSINVPPIQRPGNNVLLAPSDGAMALVDEAIMAASRIDLDDNILNGWSRDALGRPEYSREGRKAAGSILYIPPGHDRFPANIPKEALNELSAQLWQQVATLGPAHLQFIMLCSNQFMNMAQPTQGFLINHVRFAEFRRLNLERINKKSKEERGKFNSIVQVAASLDVNAIVDRNRGTKSEKRHEIRGRIIIPEAVGAVYQGPLEGLPGVSYVDISAWRILPGTAWLASRAIGQIGRYPTQLIELDPHNKGFLIKLGAYLGHQTAVRATYGTLDQPLGVRTILTGIREPIPTIKQRLSDLKRRLEDALDELQQIGVLLSWQWVIDPTGSSFLDNSILFLYHQGSIADHAAHHPKTQAALERQGVQDLLPEGHTWKQKASKKRGGDG